jgi:hypothetical protein
MGKAGYSPVQNRLENCSVSNISHGIPKTMTTRYLSPINQLTSYLCSKQIKQHQAAWALQVESIWSWYVT